MYLLMTGKSLAPTVKTLRAYKNATKRPQHTQRERERFSPFETLSRSTNVYFGSGKFLIYLHIRWRPSAMKFNLGFCTSFIAKL